MVELIWKDKHPLADQAPSTIRLQTYECHGEQPSSGEGWYNRLIWGDKSHVLPALLSEFADSIHLIYVDPPFMTGRDFHFQYRTGQGNGTRKTAQTSSPQLAYSDKWHSNLDAYLQWLYETFILLHKLLAPTGSFYVHLDWRVVHYAKVLLDEVFGSSPKGNGPGFKNEIIWHYQSGGHSHKHFARKHDTLLLYTKSAQYCFHGERIGERRGSQKRNHMRKQLGTDGHTTWTIRSSGRIYTYSEETLMTPVDVWHDISHLHQKDPQRNGYATQKPTALLERILLASSEEQDLVLDCFCGSGVTPAVAEQLGRRWIACDQSELAITTTRERLLARAQLHSFVLQREVI